MARRRIRRLALPAGALAPVLAAVIYPPLSAAPATAGQAASTYRAKLVPAVVETVAADRAASAAPAADGLFADLQRLAPALDSEVLRMALDARDEALAAGQARRGEVLSVIDYSLPSTAQRLWVFDVDRGELLFHELVAHGKNTGANRAAHFSNDDGSLQSSLGLFRTADTYYGKNGYSLRLVGLEPGVNDHALPRTIVIHGADYVSQDWVARYGRIGRSWGCPAVRKAVARPLIDSIKDGSLVFAYYPDERWIAGSRYLASYRAGSSTPDTVVAAR